MLEYVDSPRCRLCSSKALSRVLGLADSADLSENVLEVADSDTLGPPD